MPKITRNFVQGKMNRDLDSRLIPPGQYRDALNIRVANSEGSDVGAVQNIQGTVLTTSSSSASQQWASLLGLGGGPDIVGIYKDTLKDHIYYFLNRNNTSAIMQYSVDDNYLKAVIVDTRSSGNVLNFDISHPITGVNILDGILFFTDDLNEPKKINVERFKAATAAVITDSLDATTSIYGREVKISDITVIKPSPKQAVSMTATSTKLAVTGGAGYGVVPIKLTAKLTGSDGYPLVEDDTVTILEFDEGVFKPSSVFLNKIVKLTSVSYKTDGTKIKYEATAKITSITEGEVPGEGNGATLEMISVSKNVPDNEAQWDLVVIESEPIFKNNFPRFSYRWKYLDGEYSTYAPFSQAAFVPAQFSYEPEEGYNLGMDDNIRKITLTFPTDTYALPPKDVKEIEILYKGIDSQNVYVLDTHLTDDGTLSTFEIDNDLLGPVIEELQLLRLYDNVPRKAKAQEIIGNRVVYGNYLHNYTLGDVATITGSVDDSSFTLGQKYRGQKSVKTDRKYQIGITFLDEHGRESPVFTNKEAAVSVNIENSDKINKLQASTAMTTVPSWAEYYKYYVKDSSPEYYNLALDRYYDSEDGNVWLSFPSSERNKVSEGDFLTLKKKHGNNTPVTIDNKYKILDISNEAPPSIANVNQGIVRTGILIDDPAADFDGNILSFQSADATNYRKLEDNLKANNQIQFVSSDGTKTSRLYNIANGGVETGIGNHNGLTYYQVVLSDDELEADDVFFKTGNSSISAFVVIYDRSNNLLPEFQGKFFAKVAKNSSFENNVINSSVAVREAKVLTSSEISEDESTPTATFAGKQELSYGLTNNGKDGADSGDNTVNINLYVSKTSVPPSTAINHVFYRSDAGIVYDSATVGTKVRFKNSDGDVSEIYTITSVSESNPTRTLSSVAHKYKKKVLTFDRNIGGEVGNYPSTIEIVSVSNPSGFQVPNPAIFETKPLELADLDIYYEATDALQISGLSNTVDLDFNNCFSFGNGIESDRIRDDFNAPLLGKGVRVSTVLQQPYEEERLGASMIYSGIVNTRSGINESSQFTTAIKITKDLPNTHGSIQKLHARDTNLIALCEDKVFNILANKNALFNADGNTNITSSNNVLGQAIPFAGEFGISKNPETFASYGFRAYFADKSRGKVLRLSRDGITDISSKGMTNFFEDKFANHTGLLTGSYDENMGTYNIHFVGNESVSFKEEVNGWTTRLSLNKAFATSLNNIYYSIGSDGFVFRHDGTSHNLVHGSFYDSTITFFFNDVADKVKNFKTLAYQGDSGWEAEIYGTHADGVVDEWKEREGMYFNYIKGLEWGNTLDLKEFSVQGIGMIDNNPTQNSDVWTISFAKKLNDSLSVGDVFYVVQNNLSREVGPVLTIDGTTITVDGSDSSITPANNNFALFAKDREVNTSGVKAFAAKVKMTLPTGNTTKKELFAVNSEVFISSE